MVNRPKNIGTAAESAVVAACKRLGYPKAHRRTQTGSKDQGDILLFDEFIIEVKGGKAAWHASTNQIEQWLEETETERVNADAEEAFLVVQRKGVGLKNADQWWAYSHASIHGLMMLELGNPTSGSTKSAPDSRIITIRTTLQQMLAVVDASFYDPERKP